MVQKREEPTHTHTHAHTHSVSVQQQFQNNGTFDVFFPFKTLHQKPVVHISLTE